jgi:hypothetical protein
MCLERYVSHMKQYCYSNNKLKSAVLSFTIQFAGPSQVLGYWILSSLIAFSGWNMLHSWSFWSTIEPQAIVYVIDVTNVVSISIFSKWLWYLGLQWKTKNVTINMVASHLYIHPLQHVNFKFSLMIIEFWPFLCSILAQQTTLAVEDCLRVEIWVWHVLCVTA